MMSQIDLTKAESDWVEAMVLGAALLRGDLAGVVLAGAFIGYFVGVCLGFSISGFRHVAAARYIGHLGCGPTQSDQSLRGFHADEGADGLLEEFGLVHVRVGQFERLSI